MRYRSLFLPVLALGLMLTGCASVDQIKAEHEGNLAVDSDLDTLNHWMSGSFTSAAQAAEDSTYYEIELEMQPIWTDRRDGRWLYVEQAVASHKSRPYRQRIYRLRRQDEMFLESAVYRIADEERFVGAYQNVDLFNNLSPDSLLEREGCAIILERMADGTFGGSTQGIGCESTLRGASYATSHVTIRQTRIMSWDRGYDADGNQAWGATQAGYIFEKMP
ncbi:chromophore lyase CpcT/CpeT [bacterium]|nr:chromophore lyase CpcT/CpeT [bacterium]